MILIFLYSLMCYGIANAIVYYTGPFDIFSKFRDSISGNEKLEELFSCMFCLPTNIGIVMSILSLLFGGETPFTPFTMWLGSNVCLWPLILLFDGFYTGAIVSIIDSIVNRIQPQEETNVKEILND